MTKGQSPRQQNMKQNKEAMQILSKILSRRKNACPQRRNFKSKEDSRRQIKKECITKKIIYS
jgi:hypothetical protein